MEGNQAAERAADVGMDQMGADKKKRRKKSQHQHGSSSGDAGASSALSMLGGDDDDDDVSVESLTDWKEENRDDDDRLLDGEENLSGNAKEDLGEETDLTLSHVLRRSGEANMQSPEVMEQWLLLIYHLAGWSPLARQTLVNASVDVVVTKITVVQIQHVYLIALCEMCVALIRTEEEEHFEL